MRYTVSDILMDARVVLDMNNSSEALSELGDVDTLTLDEIIESKIPASARIVHRDAARHLIGRGEPFGSEIKWRGEIGVGSGIITLPDDFLRLVSLKMSDWAYAVTEALTDDSPRYRIIRSGHPAAGGTPSRPVAVLAQYPSGQVLEFYSCNAGAGVTLTSARYIRIPSIHQGGIELSEKLKDAVVYHAAAMTAFTMGAADAGNNLLDIAKTLMR